MLERFLSEFLRDGAEDASLRRVAIRAAGDIVPLLGGQSFKGGLYRVHAPDQAVKWAKIVTSVFHQYADRVECFGYDWLGRQFALDAARIEDGSAQVLMFQVGMGEVYQIPGGIVGFHDHDLLDLPEAALELSLYEAWRAAGNPAPGLSQCAGYKVPPVLGGRDEVENLMLIDMEVEWEMTGQLLQVASALPKGARIDKVTIGE